MREDRDKKVAFAKKEAGNLPIEFSYNDEKEDTYCIRKEGNRFKVTASNPRSCLYAVYHVLEGKPSGKFKAEFPIRGINTVETLTRYSTEQIKKLIDRMGRWKMNKFQHKEKAK